jgi:hypothetical protein
MIQFEENQRFKELAIYILLGLLQLLFLWGFIQQVIFNKPWGTKPASDLALIIINMGMFLFIILFFSFNLKTVITEQYISFRFFPLQTKMRIIYWKQVKCVSVIKYDGMKEYWGFGLKYMPGKGWCYTMPGHYGIKLTLTSGKTILIGTHMAEEVTQIINVLKKRGTINVID